MSSSTHLIVIEIIGNPPRIRVQFGAVELEGLSVANFQLVISENISRSYSFTKYIIHTVLQLKL